MSDRQPIMSRGPGGQIVQSRGSYARSGNYNTSGTDNQSTIFVVVCLLALGGAIAGGIALSQNSTQDSHIAKKADKPVPPTPVEHALYKGHYLVFSDDFDTLDHAKWKHHVYLAESGGSDFQMFQNKRSTSYVEDGRLSISPKLTADEIGAEALSTATYDVGGSGPIDTCTSTLSANCIKTGESGEIIPPIQSARLSMREFSFKYGRVEVTARLPCGDWYYPYFRLLPKDNVYGSWPASGEIYILEARGNNCSYPDGGNDRYRVSVHLGTTQADNIVAQLRASLNQTEWCGYDNATNLSAEDHVYGLVWNTSGIWAYFDTEDTAVLAVEYNGTHYDAYFEDADENPWAGAGDDAPFDQKFYLDFGVRVGGVSDASLDGEFFADAIGKPWDNDDSDASEQFWNQRALWNVTGTPCASLSIDKIEVYQTA